MFLPLADKFYYTKCHKTSMFQEIRKFFTQKAQSINNSGKMTNQRNFLFCFFRFSYFSQSQFAHSYKQNKVNSSLFDSKRNRKKLLNDKFDVCTGGKSLNVNIESYYALRRYKFNKILNR